MTNIFQIYDKYMTNILQIYWKKNSCYQYMLSFFLNIHSNIKYSKSYIIYYIYHLPYPLIENKMKFTPFYKYMRYPWQVSSNALSVTDKTGGDAACITTDKYCAHKNHRKSIFQI